MIDISRKLYTYLLIIFMLLSGGLLFGAPDVPETVQKERGDYLTFKIAVMGPGDELYFWWGHIGLIIEDELTGRADFYDYGLFSFENEHFFTNFAMGRLIYSCGVSPAEMNLQHYIRTNRDITLLTLNLSAKKKEDILNFARKNILPANRDYEYHHFRDNCATRIRDIIDMGTEGQFYEAFGEAAGRYTLRQQVRRHTWFSPYFDWLLNFLMGQNIDVPLTVWEEMFLPSEIGRRITDFVYTDETGTERKLVTSVEVLYRAENRPGVLEIPRRQWPAELLFSVTLCFIIAGIFLLRKKQPRAGRILLGTTQGLLGLFFGIPGLVLFFMTFFTNHDYTYNNINLLFGNPLLLAAIPLGIMLATGKKNNARYSPDFLLKCLWTLCFFGAVIALAIRILPGFYQQNFVDLALFMPIAGTLSFLPRWIGKWVEKIREYRR
jgi:hypothetical protein